MFETLKKKNPSLPLFAVSAPEFSRYGRVVCEYDFTPWIQVMASREIPKEGNIYIADDPALSGIQPAQQVQDRLYAGMPLQAGYCNGNGNKLNALEYHKSSELNVAITDLVLLLADIRDIADNTLSSHAVQGFYLPAGTACELYATALHFAPCKTNDSGFKCIVVLPQGTNQPLEALPNAACDEEKLLWMRNKWLIAHQESIPASKGAFVGITGDNIEVRF